MKQVTDLLVFDTLLSLQQEHDDELFNRHPHGFTLKELQTRIGKCPYAVSDRLSNLVFQGFVTHTTLSLHEHFYAVPSAINLIPRPALEMQLNQ